MPSYLRQGFWRQSTLLLAAKVEPIGYMLNSEKTLRQIVVQLFRAFWRLRRLNTRILASECFPMQSTTWSTITSKYSTNKTTSEVQHQAQWYIFRYHQTICKWGWLLPRQRQKIKPYSDEIPNRPRSMKIPKIPIVWKVIRVVPEIRGKTRTKFKLPL